MLWLKNGLFLACCLLCLTSALSAQERNSPDKTLKFTLINADKLQNSLLNENIKYLSGGVIFKIGHLEIHADSAVVIVNENRFEAFGNIVCYKNGKINFSSDRAYYRAETRHIMFMDNISLYNEDGTANKIMVPSIEFDVSE